MAILNTSIRISERIWATFLGLSICNQMKICVKYCQNKKKMDQLFEPQLVVHVILDHHHHHI